MQEWHERLEMKKFRASKAVRMLCGCVLMMGMVFTTTACSKEDANGTEGSVSGTGETMINVEDYMVDMLKVDYTQYLNMSGVKDLKITSADITPESDYVTYQVMSSIGTTFGTAEADRPVQAGDTLTIDYTGYINDVKFEGGSATGATLGIGSGSYIDGFEAGLIGAKKGDKVTLNLKFPEDYHEEDYAGKDVKFDVTVVKITAPKEVTDKMVTDKFKEEYAGYDAYYKSLEADVKQSYRDDMIWKKYCEAVEVIKEHKELNEEYIAMNLYMVDYYAAMYQTNRATYLSQMYGMTETQFREYMADYAKEYAKQKLMILGLTKELGITITDAQRAEIIKDLIEGGEYKNEEEMRKDYTESELEFEILYQSVFDYLEDIEIVEE